MSTPAVPLPAELTYGFVTGRFVLVVGDSTDADKLPDGRPAAGMVVTFTPATTLHRIGAVPTTVLRAPLVCEVGTDGYLREKGAAAVGVWLVTGAYKVAYSGLSTHALPTPLTIEVTEAHTEASPLDLTVAHPYVPDPAVPANVMQVVGSPIPGYLIGVSETGALTYQPPVVPFIILDPGEPVPEDVLNAPEETLVLRRM